MMGLFVMAALMAFQSIPINQAVSQELTESFTDLSRVAETKSYGDLYFFNFVPNGADHSVSHMSHTLGQIGGNVSWNYQEFESSDAAEQKADEIASEFEEQAQEYFNAKYGGISQRNSCTIPSINYTTDLYPDSNTIMDGVDSRPSTIPVKVRSQVDYNFGDLWSGLPFGGGVGTGGVPSIYTESNTGTDIIDAARMKVECSPEQGSTQYIGSTDGIGFTNELEVSANRYLLLGEKTSNYYKDIHDEWLDVEAESGYSSWKCSVGRSEKVSAANSAVSQVDSTISNGKSTATNNLQGSLPDQVEIETNNINSSDSFLSGDVTTGKFSGSLSTTRQSDPNECDCDQYGCDDPEYRYKATATPETSDLVFTLNDTKYRSMTENGWETIEFKVRPYSHDYQND